jgi:trehalose-6-phosphate synthase
VFHRHWWKTYKAVNERFAEARLSRSMRGPDAVRWVHDYHLMLLPALLREQTPKAPIGFFLHVPFPAPELFARLPWRSEILAGLLGADLVAFHVDEYRDNFLATCRRLCEADVDEDGVTLPSGRRVEVAAHPISIDAADFAQRAVGPSTERCLAPLRRQFAGRTVLLGVDRLDYTKGITERLRAIEALLDRRPDLVGRLAFIQIAVPSRGEVREYRDLRDGVEQLVGHVNGRFTEPGHDVPIHYLYRGVGPDRLLAYYRLASVCLVTPLRDGMNLVAKEFAVTQAAGGGRGALVLSEFTGAADELPEALSCNPYDIDGVAATIERALALTDEDRSERLARMAERVHEHDVHAWVERELGAIDAAAHAFRPAGAR